MAGGPPKPGEDPDFDRMVMEEMRKRGNAPQQGPAPGMDKLEGYFQQHVNVTQPVQQQQWQPQQQQQQWQQQPPPLQQQWQPQQQYQMPQQQQMQGQPSAPSYPLQGIPSQQQLSLQQQQQPNPQQPYSRPEVHQPPPYQRTQQHPPAQQTPRGRGRGTEGGFGGHPSQPPGLNFGRGLSTLDGPQAPKSAAKTAYAAALAEQVNAKKAAEAANRALELRASHERLSAAPFATPQKGGFNLQQPQPQPQPMGDVMIQQRGAPYNDASSAMAAPSYGTVGGNVVGNNPIASGYSGGPGATYSSNVNGSKHARGGGGGGTLPPHSGGGSSVDPAVMARRQKEIAHAQELKRQMEEDRARKASEKAMLASEDEAWERQMRSQNGSSPSLGGGGAPGNGSGVSAAVPPAAALPGLGKGLRRLNKHMEESGWAPNGGPSPFRDNNSNPNQRMSPNGGLPGNNALGGGGVYMEGSNMASLQPQSLQYPGVPPPGYQPQQPWEQQPPWQQQQQQQNSPLLGQPPPGTALDQQHGGGLQSSAGMGPTYARQRLISGGPDANEQGVWRDKAQQQKSILEQQILDNKQRKLEEQKKERELEAEEARREAQAAAEAAAVDQKAAAAKKQEELDNLQKLYADQALAVAQRKNKAAKEAQDAKDDANTGGVPLSPPRAPQPDNSRGPFAQRGDGAPAVAAMQGDSKDSGFSPQPRVAHTPPRQHHHQSPQPPLSLQHHHQQQHSRQHEQQPHQQPTPADRQSNGRGMNEPHGGFSPMQLYQQRHQQEPTQELQPHDLQHQQLQEQQLQQQQIQQQEGGLDNGVEYGGQAPREEGYVDFNAMLAEEMARQRQALTPALQGGAGPQSLVQQAYPGAARVSFAADMRNDGRGIGYNDYDNGSMRNPSGRIANNPMEKSLATAFGTLLPAPNDHGYSNDQYGSGGDSNLNGLYSGHGNTGDGDNGDYGKNTHTWALEPYGGGLGGGGGPPLGGSIESLDQFVRSWQHKNPVDGERERRPEDGPNQRRHPLGSSNSINNSSPPRMPLLPGESPRRGGGGGGGSARGSMRQRPPSTGEQSLAGDSLLMYLNGTAGAARAASTLPENNGQPAALFGNGGGGLNAGDINNTDSGISSSGQGGNPGGGDDPFQALVALYPTTAATPQRGKVDGSNNGASDDAGMANGDSVLLDVTRSPAAPLSMNPNDTNQVLPQPLMNMSGSGGAMREMFAAYGQPPLTVDLPQQQYHPPNLNDGGGGGGAGADLPSQDYVASPASAQAPPPRAAPRLPPSTTSIPHEGNSLNGIGEEDGGDEVVVVPGLELRGHQGGFQPEKPAHKTNAMPAGGQPEEKGEARGGSVEGNGNGDEGALEGSVESYANTSVSSFNGSV